MWDPVDHQMDNVCDIGIERELHCMIQTWCRGRLLHVKADSRAFSPPQDTTFSCWLFSLEVKKTQELAEFYEVAVVTTTVQSSGL